MTDNIMEHIWGVACALVMCALIYGQIKKK